MPCGSSENRRVVLAGFWCLPWNPFSARFPVRSGGLSTKGPSIAAYAVRSVARNRRGTASALLGLVLAVAVISAPWIALDSTLRGLVAWYVDGLPTDAFAYGDESTLANATRDLAAVQNVERVEPAEILFASANVSGNVVGTSLLLVRPTFGDAVPRLGLAWTAPPSSGRAVVSDYFETLGLGIGDTLSFEWQTPVFAPNSTVIGYDVRWANFTISGFYQVVRPERGFTTITAFLSMDDVPAVKAGANLTGYPLAADLFVWLDREALFNPYDLSGSGARLNRQAFLMQNALRPYNFFIQYTPSIRGPSLDRIPQLIDDRTIFLRFAFTIFTLPTFTLAGLLARVGFEIGITGRRRELAVLMARGLSVRGVRGVLFIEASVLAGFGGLVGLGVGGLLSRLFLSSATFEAAVQIPLGDVAISPVTVALALLVAWALAVGGSWRLSRIMASQDIVSAFKAHHAAEVSIPHRASRDFLMAAVASAGFLLLFASGSTKGSPASIVTFLLDVSTSVLAPIAPFLLTAAIARYLTRGTTRAYRAVSRLLRPALGELHPLVDKNLARVPRRSSNIAIVVTFAVGFVVAIFVITASYLEYRNRVLLTNTPADVVAEQSLCYDFGCSPRVDFPNATALTRLHSIPGVASVTPVLIAESERAIIVFFEASTFLQSVRWLTAGDLGGVDPAALMARLDRGDGFAANTIFTNTFGVQPGDVLQFDALGGNLSLRFVAGVPAIPGLYTYGPGPAGEALVYVDLSAVPPSADISSIRGGRYLIGLAASADSAFVAREVGDLFQGRLFVRTLDDARNAAAQDPAAVAVLSFLETQTQIAVAMLVVGVTLFVFSASAERRNELATLVARGIGTRAAGTLVAAEGWVVTILGLLLGVMGGLVTAGTALAIANIVNPTSTVVPFVIPLSVLVPMGGAVLGVAAAGLLGAASVRGMDVVRVLKLRGG